jgi:hypothetical protein
VRDLE